MPTFARPQGEVVVAAASREVVSRNGVNSVVSIPASGVESIDLFAPAGHISRPVNLFANIGPNDGGAASGTQSLRIGVYDSVEGAFTVVLLGESAFNEVVTYGQGHWASATQQALPPTEQLLASRGILYTDVVAARLRTHNDADQPTTALRRLVVYSVDRLVG